MGPFVYYWRRDLRRFDVLRNPHKRPRKSCISGWLCRCGNIYTDNYHSRLGFWQQQGMGLGEVCFYGVSTGSAGCSATHGSGCTGCTVAPLEQTYAEQLLGQIFGDGFAAGVDVEFAVDAFDVHADRINADREDVGDFFVGNALGKAVEDFFFAF
jgi:hypothetical protein